jgi:endo-1,4-beta-xylanase
VKIKIISAFTILVFLASVQSMAQKTLGEATKGKFLFGVAVSMPQVNGVNPIETELIAKEFSAVVAENCMKPQPIHPEENSYKWDDADKFVAFGEKIKIQIV